MNKEREIILLFLGWPKMLKLLAGTFFSMLMKDYQLVIFDKKINPKKLKGGIVGLASSAGAKDLVKMDKEYPGLFKKRIFIAPAGISGEERSFPRHCWEFLKELFKLLWRGRLRLFGGIAVEVIANFVKDRKGSVKEINKIRKFDLWKELKSLGLDENSIFFIFPMRDRFMDPSQAPQNSRIEKNSGHFVLCENPERIFGIVKEIIDNPKLQAG